MRVVVFGATGNVGTAAMRALSADPAITSIVGVARRAPVFQLPKVVWHTADISRDPLDVVAHSDVVVHLAWKIQPQHKKNAMAATNIGGTRRILEATVRHAVPAVVYASSVGAYAPGPKDSAVDESWPVTGIKTSTYSRHKAAVEAMLDDHERCYGAQRIVRMRTSLVFQRAAASQIHRLFAGRFAPWHLPRWARLIPAVDGLVFQATHADDIADAYRRAVLSDRSGPFNIAAQPVLDPRPIAATVSGRTVSCPAKVLHAAVAATFALRLQPTEPGWLDMAIGTPLMSTTRAETELGWSASMSSTAALAELFDGIGAGNGAPTIPLTPRHATL